MATDGSSFVARGICVVVEGLARHSLHPHLRVVCPVGTTGRVRHDLSSIVSLNGLSFFEAPTDPADPYRLQIALCDAARTFGSEHVLALDYDHLVLRDISNEPDVWPGNGVYASSEMVDLEAEGMWPARAAQALGPAPPHINTSLLCADGDTLYELRDPWADAYEEVAPHVGPRFRVELALSLAAHRHGLPIGRVPPDFQASFAAPHREPALFHYGGTSRMAKQMKAVLTTDDQAIGSANIQCLRLQLERLYRGTPESEATAENPGACLGGEEE